MRTAIWAAVSTPKQAKEEKVSIQLQLQKGREFIASRRYTPAGEYIVPGESRTKYISLYQAEKEIKPLHQLLEAASRKEFDLLFVYDLNRFRTLMRQVFDVLCDYNIQLYIYTNPREPVPKNQYTEEHKAAVGMVVDLGNIISRSETSNLARHFREKMPARIQRGLDARLGSIPYGYKRIHPGDKEHPLIQEPSKARVVKQIAEWYLNGSSFKSICKRLNEKKIPAPEGGIWYPETIRVILSSPYYAGIVYFAREKYHRDRRTGKESRTPNPNPVYGKGKHKPLWDEATHQKILDLIERRGRGFKGDKTKRLSRLLYCPCGKKLYHDRSKKTGSGKPYPYWRCSSNQAGHAFISDKKALDLVIPAVVEGIRKTPRLPQPKETTDPIAEIETEIAEIQRRKKKWMDIYENTEDLDSASIIERLRAIENELNEAQAKLTKQRIIQTRRKSTHTTRAKLAQLLDHLQGYYLQAPAAQVNADLHDIIDHITITKDHQVHIHWRGED